MNFDKKKLGSIIQTTCSDLGWKDILYAGVVGSAVVITRNRDLDVVVILSKMPETPCVFHHGYVSLVVLNTKWLNYTKHLTKPMGLVPSVLFKSIELSDPIIGNKNRINIPKIKVCEADWINVEIKKKRYKNIDRKNYLVALLFERLLEVSPDLSYYIFDNIEVAKKIGAADLAKELMMIYEDVTSSANQKRM